MGQPAVQRCIGRLLTDEAWRVRFRRDPEATLAALADGLPLTPTERAALRSMSAERWESLAEAIDPRLQRVDAPGGDA